MANKLKLNESILDESEILKGQDLPPGILARVRRTICEINKTNANRRRYKKEVWEKVLSDPDFKKRLTNRQIVGEMEHPEGVQLKLDKDRTSHIVSNMFIDEKTNTVKADFDLLPTDAGKFIHILHEAGMKVGASTRAEGELVESEEDGEKFSDVVPEKYRFVTIDHTGDPSCGATEPESIVTAVRKGYENKEIGKSVACALLEMAGSENAKKLEEAIRADLQHEDCKCPIDKKSCGNCQHAKEAKVNEDSSEGRVFEIDIKKFLADKDYELRGSRFVVIIGSKGWLLVQDEAVHWKANLGEPVKTAVWDKMIWDPKTGSGKFSMFPRETPELIELHDLEKAAIPQSSPEPFDWTEFIHYWGIKPRMGYNYGLLQKSAKEIGAFVDFPAWGSSKNADKEVEESKWVVMVGGRGRYGSYATEEKAEKAMAELKKDYPDLTMETQELMEKSKVEENLHFRLSTPEGKGIYADILAYMELADDPKYNKIVRFRKRIEKLSGADKAVLVDYFNREFGGDWMKDQKAWDYYTAYESVMAEAKKGDVSSLQKLKKEAYAYFDSVKIVPTPEEIVDFVASAIEDDTGVTITDEEFHSLAKKLGMKVDESTVAFTIADDDKKEPEFDKDKNVYTVSYFRNGKRATAVFKNKDIATAFFDKVKARQNPYESVESKINEESYVKLKHAMKNNGWSETEGVGLWTNPQYPGIFVDTNAIIEVFDGKTGNSLYTCDSYGELRSWLEKKSESKIRESLLKVGDKVKYHGKEYIVKVLDLENWSVTLELPGVEGSVTVTPEEIEEFMTESKLREGLEVQKDSQKGKTSYSVRKDGKWMGVFLTTAEVKKAFPEFNEETDLYDGLVDEARKLWSVQHAYNEKYNKKFATKEDAIAHAKSFRKGKDYDGNYHVVDPDGNIVDESAKKEHDAAPPVVRKLRVSGDKSYEAVAKAEMAVAAEEYAAIESRMKQLEENYAKDIMFHVEKLSAKTAELAALSESGKVTAEKNKKLQGRVEELEKSLQETKQKIAEMQTSHESKLSSLEEAKKQELATLAESHKSAVEALNTEHQKALLNKYKQCRVSFSGLTLPESVQALLEQASSEEDVEQLLSHYRKMIREGVHFTADTIRLTEGKTEPKTKTQVMFESALTGMLGKKV